ncbi:MAG: ferrous iron transport protein A [Verrucomicrobia bacterium]|nr:ferrous iron transport protein A [Verrucomicrobiota bacterium]
MNAFASPKTANPDCEICGAQSLCPLTEIQAGTTVRIRRLNVSDELCQRLREIGFFEQQVLQCLAQRGGVICQIDNCRMGIGAKLAEGILVERIAVPC